MSKARLWIRRQWQLACFEWRVSADGFELTKIQEPYAGLRYALRRRRELREMARSVGVDIHVRIERVSMKRANAEADAFMRHIRAQGPGA